jgi:hypothetical protein
VYSDRTRGELQVAKNNFFCSVHCKIMKLSWGPLQLFFHFGRKIAN